MRRVAAAALVLAALAGASCHSKGSTVLVVTVTLSGVVPPVMGLDVSVIAPARSDDKVYATGQPISFPTTLTAELPARITGDVTLNVKATGADGKTLAAGKFTGFISLWDIMEGKSQCAKLAASCLIGDFTLAE